MRYGTCLRTRRSRLAALVAALVAAALISSCGDGGSGVEVASVAPSPTADGAGAATPTDASPTTAATTPPLATSVTPPPRPDSLFAGGNLVAQYLADGAAGLEACLPELVEAWALPAVEGRRCVFADLDGDGAEEFALLVTLPASGSAPVPGDVWLFESADEHHRLFSSARSFANTVLEDVDIVAATDLTGDGLPEIVISSTGCAAAGCITTVLIISAHRGTFENLAPDALQVPGREPVRVEDVTGDGSPNPVLRAAPVESAGAGPQRAYQLVLSWSGLKFFVAEQQDPPRYLFHVIADADALYASGDFAGARALYQTAAEDRSLDDWKTETGARRPGRDELAPYALFRAGLSAVREGDSDAALALFDRTFDEHPLSLHGRAAAAYGSRLRQGSTPAQACRLTVTFLDTRAAEFAQIWDYGYENPEHTIDTLCS